MKKLFAIVLIALFLTGCTKQSVQRTASAALGAAEFDEYSLQ